MMEVRAHFLSRIEALDLDGHWIRSEVAGRFSWNKIGLAYAKMLTSVERDEIHSGRPSFFSSHMYVGQSQ